MDHLDRIQCSTSAPRSIEEIAGGVAPDGSWAITFDDGGSSAVAIGEELARRGWRGSFFVVTSMIGAPAFLSGDEIRALEGLGHLIGSHSSTHPRRMASASHSRLLQEWTASIEQLSELLGRPVSTASVPGGSYSPAVAVAAAAAGVKVLCTSEPVRTGRSVDGCRVLGRCAIHAGVGPAAAARFAAGSTGPWARARAGWNARKLLRAAGGGFYERARSARFARR